MGLFDRIDDPTLEPGAANPFLITAPAPPVDAPPMASAAPAVAPQGLLDPAQASAAPAAEPQGGLRGLLARIMAPSADGLTFGDKLFATGGILKGDSEGASKYLTGRRAEVAKQKADADKLTAAREASADLAAAYDPVTKHFDPAKYVALRASHNGAPDDKVLTAIYGPSLPKNVVTTGKNNEVSLINENTLPGQNPVVWTQPGSPTPNPGYHWLGDPSKGDFREAYNVGGSADPDVLNAATDARQRAIAAHRAPPHARGPRRLSFDPSEVH